MNKNLHGEKLHKHIVWRRNWKRWLIRQLIHTDQVVDDVLRFIIQLERKDPLQYEYASPTMRMSACHPLDFLHTPQYETTLATMTKHVVARGYQTIRLTYPGFEAITMSCCPEFLFGFSASAQPTRGQWYLCYKNALGGNAMRCINDKAYWTLEDMMEWLEYDHLIQRKVDAPPDYARLCGIERKIDAIPAHEPIERQLNGEARFLKMVDKFEALKRFSTKWMDERDEEQPCSSNASTTGKLLWREKTSADDSSS